MAWTVGNYVQPSSEPSRSERMEQSSNKMTTWKAMQGIDQYRGMSSTHERRERHRLVPLND